MRDGGGREETAASSGDDRSVRERRSVVRRRRTTGENNDLGGEGKHAAQIPIAGGPLRRGGVARDHQPSIIEFGVKSTGVSYQLEESR